nr:hypothetical protein GCM10020185_23230 [Pseudomonas brassicacearum subsp. brassicacearum]
MMQQPGRLIGLGVGPGDPELITVKALRLLRESPVVAYFVAKGKKGNAFGIIEAHLQDAQTLLPLVYPVTTEALPAPLSYEQVIADFYDTAAGQLAVHLDAGRDVAVICEGDPFFSTAPTCTCTIAWPSAMRPRSFPGCARCWAGPRCSVRRWSIATRACRCSPASCPTTISSVAWPTPMRR